MSYTGWTDINGRVKIASTYIWSNLFYYYDSGIWLKDERLGSTELRLNYP